MMTKKLLNLLVIVFIVTILAPTVLAGQPPQRPNYIYTPAHEVDLSQPLTKAEMLEDLNFFMDLFLQVHPNPYRFISQQELQAHFDQLKQRIKDLPEPTLPAVKFLFFVSELTAPIQDEHVQINFSRWNQESFFPYQIKIFDRKVYVVKSYRGEEENPAVPMSAQILAINGIPMAQMLDQMLLWQNRALDHSKYLAIERFFARYLHYFYEMKDQFQITYQYQGQTKEIVVSAVIPSQNQPSSQFIPYQSKMLQIAGEEVPVLELNTFGIQDVAEYNRFIDNFFKENRDRQHLVIDIRNNGGGSDGHGYYVLSYIADDKYQITEDYRIKVSKISRKFYRYDVDRAYYQRGIPRFLWWFPFYKFNDSGTFVWERLKAMEDGEYLEFDSSYRTPFDSENKFNGQVYLLFGGHTGSAAINMARAFTYNQMGIAIGSETGHPDSYSGNINQFQMAHSKIVFTLPISFGMAPGGDTKRGTMPDQEVTYTVDDYVQGRDLEMELVEKLIEEGK